MFQSPSARASVPRTDLGIRFVGLLKDTHIHTCILFQIRNGTVDDWSDPIIRVCGSVLPDPIVDFSGDILVNFKSDGSVSRQGFRLHYTSQILPDLGKVRRFIPNKAIFRTFMCLIGRKVT